MRITRRFVVFACAMTMLAGCATTSPEAERLGDKASKAATINAKLGIGYMERGDLDTAMNKFKKAMAQDPDLAIVQGGVAVLYQRLGEYDKAQDHFERAIEIDPNDSGTLNNYGRYLCLRGNAEEAEKKFMKAAANPLYQRPEIAYANAGICAMDSGDREKAKEFFRQALEKDRRFPPVLLRMAQLRFEEGHYVSAQGYYQRYREVGPITPESLWLAVRIEDKLGHKDEASSYGMLLRQKFPDSKETDQLLQRKQDD